MLAVLSALSDLQIRGEYRSGLDVGCIDSIILGTSLTEQNISMTYLPFISR